MPSVSMCLSVYRIGSIAKFVSCLGQFVAENSAHSSVDDGVCVCV